MEKKFNWTVLLASLALVGTVLALFASTCNFDFVNLDDHSYTFRCPFVQDGFSFDHLKDAFSRLSYAAIWMPITYLSYMLDISFFGPGPHAHHAVNVVLHALNAVLLFHLLLLLARGRSPTERPLSRLSLAVVFLATAFWALHPLRVEPVAWISGRKEVLCGTFTLAGLLFWGRGRRVWGGVCCALACLSKSTAMCFPFLALALKGLLAESRETEEPTPRCSLWHRARPYLPLFLMALVTGAIAIYSHRYPENYPVQVDSSPLAVRVVYALVSMGVYVYQMFIPVGLHVDVRHPVDSLPSAGLGMAAVGALIALVLITLAGRFLAPSRTGAVRRGWSRWGYIFWCVLFAAAALGPVLGIFGSFGRSIRADRFMYLPSLAISLLAVAWCERARGRHWVARGWAIFFSLVLLPSVCLTLHLVPSWRNDYALFSRVLACDATHPRALSHVASVECQTDDGVGLGICHFRASLESEWNTSVAIKLMAALSNFGNHLKEHDEFGHRMGTRDASGGVVDCASIRRRYAAEIKRLDARITKEMAADVKAGQRFRLPLDVGSFKYEALGMVAFWEGKWAVAETHLNHVDGMRRALRQVLEASGGGEVPATDEVRLYLAAAIELRADALKISPDHEDNDEIKMVENQLKGYEKAKEILQSLLAADAADVRPDVRQEAERRIYRIDLKAKMKTDELRKIHDELRKSKNKDGTRRRNSRQVKVYN